MYMERVAKNRNFRNWIIHFFFHIRALIVFVYSISTSALITLNAETVSNCTVGFLKYQMSPEDGL
jgi:hypothetical protein